MDGGLDNKVTENDKHMYQLYMKYFILIHNTLVYQRKL